MPARRTLSGPSSTVARAWIQNPLRSRSTSNCMSAARSSNHSTPCPSGRRPCANSFSLIVRSSIYPPRDSAQTGTSAGYRSRSRSMTGVLGDIELEGAREELSNPTGETGQRDAFLTLLRSGVDAAVGIALDHYHYADALCRFGGES